MPLLFFNLNFYFCKQNFLFKYEQHSEIDLKKKVKWQRKINPSKDPMQTIPKSSLPKVFRGIEDYK